MLFLQLNVAITRTKSQTSPLVNTKNVKIANKRPNDPVKFNPKLMRTEYMTATDLRKLVPRYEEYFDQFVAYMALELKKEFKQAIEHQKYKHKWKPLSIRYKDYKKTHNLSMKIWKATGLLLRSIGYKKYNGYYLIGIDPFKKYKNGIRVLDIAKYIEYGTRRMPARPLFRPILFEMRKNLHKRWLYFLRTVKHLKV